MLKLCVLTDLMLFTSVHELQTNQSHYRLYYDASIEFFRGYHLPFAILSVTLATFFVIIPTLILILYPFRCFQKCLSYCQIRWHFLHAFDMLIPFRVAISMKLNLEHMTCVVSLLMVLHSGSVSV